MIQIEKKYLSGGIDSDSAPFALDAGSMLNAINVRFGTSEGGAVGYIESVPGTSLLFTPTGTGTFTRIGSCTDEARRYLIWFNYNTAGFHGVYAYDLQLNTTYNVLLNADVTGGLNFSLANRIQARISGDMLYWTDNLSEIRRINYIAAIKHYHAGYTTTVTAYSVPLDRGVISLIRRQPAYPLAVLKQGDANPGNFTRDQAFQFVYRYTYRDYEVSTFSMPSKLVGYNLDTDTYNYALVTFPLAEKIAQDVLKVELAVVFKDSGKMFVIKTWDKNNTADATAISSHNSGTALTYSFYNSELGIAIDSALSVKPFDIVPLTSRTLEIARNRLFLGSNKFGFNAPLKTSLVVTTEIIAPGSLTGVWVHLQYTGPVDKYLIEILGIGDAQSGYYIKPSITSMPPPGSVDFTTLTYIGSGFTNVLTYFGITSGDVLTFTNAGYTSTITSGPAVSISGSRYFKSESAYQFGGWFYDFAGRRCGVVTNKTLRKSTPDRTYADPAYVTGFSWTLDNTDALNEIPIEAVTYTVGRSKSLRTPFFMQLRADDIKYAAKDTSGNYTMTDTSYATTRAGTAINIKSLASNGMGYIYQEGDIIKLYTATDYRSLKIKAQVGDWVIADLTNLGTLPVNTLFEIYTPAKTATQELFYEIGEMYPIVNPGTSLRAYGVTSGVMAGDVYILGRAGATYMTENMSPADKFYKTWWTDIGRPNVVDTIGQQQRMESICWSNKYIPGTKTNGLSSFDALDVIDVPQDNGEIMKLQLTSKTQEEGSVMLAICRNETSSVYLGETQLLKADGSTFLATSEGVIGTINPLKGSFGTAHPESVQEYQGNVYWFDVCNGALARYSTNGLLPPPSDYKMRRFFRRYAKRYLEQNMTDAVIGGMDPYNGEYLLSLPATEAGGFIPNLPTTTRANEFEFYDGQKKTIAYKIEMDRVVSTYSFFGDGYELVGVQLFGFKDGKLYRHNDISITDNLFYGVQYTTRVCFAANSLPDIVKVISGIRIFGNMIPTYAVLYITKPYERITDLYASNFKDKEGIFYAPWYKDRLSPNMMGDADLKMMFGVKMRGETAKVMVEFTTTAAKLQLKFINIMFHESVGHLT